MGSAPKPIKRIAGAATNLSKWQAKKASKGLSFKSITKPFKKVVSYVDKKVVEPLEKPVKKVVKGVKNIADEAFEELIEKPGKKIIREVVDTVTNTDKYDRGTPRPDITEEITPEIVPDEKPTITSRYATRGKRSGQAGTIMEGYGVIQRKKSSRSVT